MDSETREETIKKLLVSVPDYIQKVQCDTDQRTPPFKCAVNTCRNFFLNFEKRDKYLYKFHSFPVDPTLCATWKEKCGLTQDTDISKLMVCSDHFSLDDYIRNYKEEFRNPDFKRRLKPGAVPQETLQDNKSVNSNDDVLFKDMKEAIAENEQLRTKYEALLNAKREATKKVAVLKNKIASQITSLKRVQGVLNKDIAKAKNNSKNKKNVISKVFSEAQINLLLGKKRVFWSDDDLAKAFTLRHMGSKECYLYLKNTLNMPLPALACVQKWAASCDSL